MNDESKPVVLVVDDNHDTRQVIRWMLEQWGYHVLEAGDGQEAIKVVTENHPDVVLMDLAMPIIDGFEAIRSIREQPGLSNLPVIAVTAFDKTDFRDRARSVEVNQYLSKPIDFRRLRILVKKLISERR
jgi:CheY-like chemotaxis protein